MFKKVPYGVKVRVKGSDETGYIAQYAICCSRFFPTFDWTSLFVYDNKTKERKTSFATLEEAQELAMAEYDSWMKYYKEKEARKAERKKVSNNIVWEHP